MYNIYYLYISYKQEVYSMPTKISTADARKQFADLINKVAYAKDPVILTRRGKPLAALVSMEDLKLLEDLKERLDIEDAWKAREEPGEHIPWEKLREELDL